MNKKYELIESDIKGLHRIKALKDFDDVKKGDIGGYVKSEYNLSQEGDCWIYDNAQVSGRARVTDNAKVYENALVYDRAKIIGHARVYDNACIYEHALIRDNAQVAEKARVNGKADIADNAKIYGKASIYNFAWIRGNAQIYGDAEVFGHAMVDGDAKVYGFAIIEDYVDVGDNVKVHGVARVGRNTILSGDAEVANKEDYIVFKNFWSSGRYFTWTRSNNMWKVGCFYGTGEQLIKKAYKDSEISGREYKRIVEYVESVLKDNFQDNSDPGIVFMPYILDDNVVTICKNTNISNNKSAEN